MIGLLIVFGLFALIVGLGSWIALDCKAHNEPVDEREVIQ